MNEIKKIHLGRQPFTISVEAHKALRDYLDAIKEAAGVKSEVVKEVELRMAELLVERGITGDKVILQEDVDFLKEQLGQPGDFKDEAGEDDAKDTKESVASDHDAPKRLYRDPQNGMLAGVSSGLAAYFGIDVTIVRLIFVVVTLLGGWGIAVYVILWLVTPPANTSSERLHMQGKAVTVDSIKELVDRADIPGAAERANQAAGPIMVSVAKVFSSVLGFVFMSVATLGLFALAIATVYGVVNRGDMLSPAYNIAGGDIVVAVCAFVVLALTFVFIALIGSAMMRFKWQVPGWVVALLIGTFFVASTVGTAMAPKTVDRINDHCDKTNCTFNDEDYR